MPFTRSEPRLAWNLSGDAALPPLVLVGGLGSAQAAWMLQVRELSSLARVLTYDHRGTGESELVDAPTTMADYAADLLRLLDELDIARATLVGLSFGGRVLLSLALARPERVRGLVLGGTSCGGSEHLPGRPEALAALRSSPLEDPAAEQARWEQEILPWLFGPVFRARHPERIRNLARWRARHPADGRGLRRQWEAFQGFDVCGRLDEIRAPTLVIHGADDAVSPLGNGALLASRIPGARLEVLDGVGHSPNVEDAPRMNAILARFLAELPP